MWTINSSGTHQTLFRSKANFLFFFFVLFLVFEIETHYVALAGLEVSIKLKEIYHQFIIITTIIIIIILV